MNLFLSVLNLSLADQQALMYDMGSLAVSWGRGKRVCSLRQRIPVQFQSFLTNPLNCPSAFHCSTLVLSS